MPEIPLTTAASKNNLGMSDPSKKHKAATIVTDGLGFSLNETDVSYKHNQHTDRALDPATLQERRS